MFVGDCEGPTHFRGVGRFGLQWGRWPKNMMISGVALGLGGFRLKTSGLSYGSRPQLEGLRSSFSVSCLGWRVPPAELPPPQEGGFGGMRAERGVLGGGGSSYLGGGGVLAETKIRECVVHVCFPPSVWGCWSLNSTLLLARSTPRDSLECPTQRLPGVPNPRDSWSAQPERPNPIDSLKCPTPKSLRWGCSK